MIRLVKGAVPQILMRNAARWTQELLAEIARGGDQLALRQSKYRQPEIKDALKDETKRKCAYCESKPLHVTHGDIEHVVPKAVAPQRAFDWANLTLACNVCNVCNTNKSDYENLLDPYASDPEDEFTFSGPMIFHVEGGLTAEYTKTTLKLNRADLLERRAERLDAINDKFAESGPLLVAPMRSAGSFPPLSAPKQRTSGNIRRAQKGF